MNKLEENYESSFAEVKSLISQARAKAVKVINNELIDLYWEIGKYISDKCNNSNWGNSVVKSLALYLKKKEPKSKGFSSQNLWRMKQFYEFYSPNKKLSPLVREIGWTNNLLILSQTKSDEEKEFYLRLCSKENYSKRELQRQLNSGFYERTILSKNNISPVAKEKYPEISNNIRDIYSLEFLQLKNNYSEYNFQKAILTNLKDFILEFGKDFLFIEEEYKLQVGNNDYKIDLLFYHRELNCLVALELKIGEFKPEYMGKMDFYLGALDKYVKKEHENSSIGIILCKSKDKNIVEISLNRSTSPTIISQYETKLINKKLLMNKLDELFSNRIDNQSEHKL
jgi:predicted nuclease of restriction endonuclease-like (RecB) superfamily